MGGVESGGAARGAVGGLGFLERKRRCCSGFVRTLKLAPVDG